MESRWGSGLTYNKTNIITIRDQRAHNKNYLFQKLLQGREVERGYYFPLKQAIFPPNFGIKVSFEWLLSIFKNISEKERREFLSSTCNAKYKSFTLLFSQPTDIDHSWFAINLTHNKKVFLPFCDKGRHSEWTFEPLKVEIHNEEFILPRGGGIKEMQTLNIAVIGCGAVGGEVALQLVKSGIGNLTLIDIDTLSIENIYRHVLPVVYLGCKKTTALKDFLSENYPYVEITAKDSTIRDLIKTDDLLSFDGVIVATGDVTEERLLNKYFIEKEQRPWVIYSWVEGLGVGGHTIYVHSTGKGCLACLFRDKESEEPSLDCIQDFLANNQDPTINLGGCGHHFMPYSSVDAVQTAVLASRFIIGTSLHKWNNSLRVSWKGPTWFTEKENLELTHRYQKYVLLRRAWVDLIFMRC